MVFGVAATLRHWPRTLDGVFEYKLADSLASLLNAFGIVARVVSVIFFVTGKANHENVMGLGMVAEKSVLLARLVGKPYYVYVIA